ncbi:hypothetical protein K402DRAFT_234707 [Aulographum hederae CBS 113979]|uniref:Transcription regulator Rua1 C-terminal domain-containing protein n=1 Tax=Aulographum hederae CBS 113979 TaxID=1176131 RepID=A0A6G1GL96_9PEZI|nr:hypothetical protein K402DRAFT_234707 [Aulographum hederae CBS 113979]
MPSYDEYSASEGISYASDCDAWSNLDNTPNIMSPTASPRHSFHDGMKNNVRTRVSPVSHANTRGSPYAMDSSRAKRWSTGMYATPAPRINPYNANRYSSFYGSPLNPHHSIPGSYAPAMSNFHPHTQNVLYSQPPHLQPNNGTMYSTDSGFAPEVSRALPSQGLFRLLQSNADRHPGCSSHFADLSDPPDLYSSLLEEPCNPPESDMHPSDPDLMPHEQDLRFTGDLYTPRWVRGHGNKREGWCGLCKPGRWLVLKNSAFWYDKSFTHGVSAATGAAFQGPQDTRRTEGNLDVWEGLCGSCGEWIALVSSKKKGTTWFRHAYKCHTHPKVKDGPKRRRETTAHSRARTSATPQASTAPPSAPPLSTTSSSSTALSLNTAMGDYKPALAPSTSVSSSASASASRHSVVDFSELSSVSETASSSHHSRNHTHNPLKREREITPVSQHGGDHHHHYGHDGSGFGGDSGLSMAEGALDFADLISGSAPRTMNPLDSFAGMI